MKHIIVIILALVFLFKQNTTAQNIGLQTGLHGSTFAKSGDLYDNDASLRAMHMGLLGNIPLGRNFVLMPELNYTNKGRKARHNHPNPLLQPQYEVHYLQLPLTVEYRSAALTTNEKSSLFINAGPYWAYAFSDSWESEDGSFSTSDKNIVSHNNDFGVILGMGYQRLLIQRSLRIQLRYDMGMNEVANMPHDFRTKSWGINLGVML